MQLRGNKIALALSFQISTSIPQLWSNKPKEFPSINLKENCKEFIFNGVSIYKLFFFSNSWTWWLKFWDSIMTRTNMCVSYNSFSIFYTWVPF